MSLEAELEAFKRFHLEEMQKMSMTFQQEIDQLRCDLSNSRNEVSSCQSTISQQSATIVDLRRRHGEGEQLIAQLRMEIDNLRGGGAEAARLKSMYEELLSQYRALEGRQGNADQLARERDALLIQIRDLRGSLDGVTRERDQLSAEMRSLGNDRHSYETTITTITEENRSLKNDCGRLSRDLDDARRDLDKIRHDYEVTVRQVTEFQGVRDELAFLKKVHAEEVQRLQCIINDLEVFRFVF